MLALAIYREARGEDLTGKIAAGCVIRNRVQHPGWYGGNWFDVITKPYQFSSFNLGDPNSAVFGSAADRAWQDSIAAALRVMGGEPDPTGGATFYFDQTRANNPPKWASIYVHTPISAHSTSTRKTFSHGLNGFSGFQSVESVQSVAKTSGPDFSFWNL
jgi:N-acetylmuramoyl-L-alanine amidase